MTPEDYIRNKRIYNRSLTTEQVDALTREFREAAAWIVGQDEAYIIAAYYDAAARIAEGNLSPAEARRLVRQTLLAAGYRADSPGSWGDMAQGTARQKLILDTNVKKAAGYAWHEAVKGDAAHPAQRLVRKGARREPRNWQARWQQAWGSLPADEKKKALPTQFVALTDCAIWSAISRWGDPYPPFDYNSGMDVLPVDRATAISLGLIPEAPSSDPSNADADGFGMKKEITGAIPEHTRDKLMAWLNSAKARLSTLESSHA